MRQEIFSKSHFACFTLLAFMTGCTAGFSESTALSARPPTQAQSSKADLYVMNLSSWSITVYNAKDGTLLHTIDRGFAYPTAEGLDSKGNLYVAGHKSQDVAVYSPGATRPSLRITDGVDGPRDLVLDAADTLYVANEKGNTVTVYAAGTSSVLRTLSDGVRGPFAMCLDRKGDLYVANHTNGTVTEYAAGSSTVMRKLSNGINDPTALALDSSGNLYVLNGATVTVYAPKGFAVRRTLTVGSALNERVLALDRSNDVYVAENEYIVEFSAGSTSILRKWTNDFYPTAYLLNAAGDLYVADGRLPGYIFVYPPGSETSKLTISNGLYAPISLAFGP